MKGWLAEFKGFLACTALCGILFSIPHETTRLVAFCAFVLLGPALFLVSSIDVVRHANARRERGEPRSAAEIAMVLPFRGLIVLFGSTSLLIGAAVCAWVLYVSHSGGLPILVSLFLGWVALRRVFWAREAISFGARLVRSALGRKEEEPEGEDSAWVLDEPSFEECLRLEPHGDVPLLLPGTSDEPDAAALALARQLPARYPSLRPAIERKLFAHYEALREENERDARPLASFPRMHAPSQVWSHVTIDHVRVAPIDGVATIEIALEPAWDADHELCLRLHDWHRIELDGDV